MNQQVLDLLGASFDLLLVAHKVDADEHEGCELGTVYGIILEDDVGVLVEELELLAVLRAEHPGALPAMQVAEKLDELVLEMTDDGILEQLLRLLNLESDICYIDSGDGNAHLVLEHGELYGEQELSLAFANLDDLALAACHWATDDNDLIALVDIAGGLSVDNLEVVTLDDGLETLHLDIANLYGRTFLVLIDIQPVTERLDPGGIEEGKDLLLGDLQEDEMMEVAAKSPLVEHGIIGFVVLFSGGFPFEGFLLQVLERDKVFERWQGAAIVGV